MIQIPRSIRHHGATGKTPGPQLNVGDNTRLGPVTQVRTRKKFARRYQIGGLSEKVTSGQWFRYDELQERLNAE